MDESVDFADEGRDLRGDAPSGLVAPSSRPSPSPDDVRWRAVRGLRADVGALFVARGGTGICVVDGFAVDGLSFEAVLSHQCAKIKPT
jgi:hypothetical protein